MLELTREEQAEVERLRRVEAATERFLEREANGYAHDKHLSHRDRAKHRSLARKHGRRRKAAERG